MSQLDNFVDDKRITGTIPIPAHKRFGTNVSNISPKTVKTSTPRSKVRTLGGQLTIPVEVLLIESPGCFYVTVPQWASEKMKLFGDMADFYGTQESPIKLWKLDDKCVVRSLKDKLFYRALILNVLEKGNYQVFLKDIARKETASAADMFELDSEFTIRDYSVQCKLGGLKPTGGLDYWSHAAIDYFKELIEQYHQLFMQKLEPVQDKIMSIKLITILDKDIGPLDPESHTKISINNLLLDEGLALPVKLISTGETITMKPEENDDIFDVEEDGDNIETDDKGSFALPDNYRRSASQITSWLPPVRFTDEHFDGWPSYVDHDGFIYIQTEQSLHILKNVSRILESCFSKAQVLSIDKYEVGNLCTVKYHLDNSYTRGIVTKTTGDKLFVRLVDFGNEEEITEDEIRAEIALTDVPMLATKCKMANVIPKTKNKKWPITVLDTLHLTIVDKKCQILLEEDDNLSEIPRISLYLNNICINKIIMEWDFDKNASSATDHKSKNVSMTEDDDVVIETDEVCNTTNLSDDVSIEDPIDVPSPMMTYQHVSLPENESSFEAIVINLIDFRTVVVEATFLRDIMQETAEQFEEMIIEINKIAPTLSSLLEPIVGLPCVGLFGSDNCWYRAEILSIDNTGNQIKILFVDYGNVEIVPLKELRPILPKWLEFPVQMLICTIRGIYKNVDEDDLDVALEMRNTLVDKKVLCEIQSLSPDLEVELFDCDSLNLIYAKLVERGVIYILE